MMLKAPATHAAYEKILAAIAQAGSMRTWEVCALLSDHSISRVRSWLTLLCARGHLRVAQETTFRSDGGHLYALGAVPLPPFDDAEQRRVYERAAACYARLHAAGSAGMTAPALLAACSEGVSLAVMSSRLLAWERKGRVRCDRSTRPARWFAVAPLMLGYTDMLAAEAHRRATTPMRRCPGCCSASTAAPPPSSDDAARYRAGAARDCISRRGTRPSAGSCRAQQRYR